MTYLKVGTIESKETSLQKQQCMTNTVQVPTAFVYKTLNLMVWLILRAGRVSIVFIFQIAVQIDHCF